MVSLFTDLSYKLTDRLSSSKKKEQGIYFTPRSIIKRAAEIIQRYTADNGITIRKVLEPSCGSCEFIQYLDRTMDGISIKGIELNDTIFAAIDQLEWNNPQNSIKLEVPTLVDVEIGPSWGETYERKK